MNDESILYNVKQAAEVMSVRPGCIYLLIKKGVLPALRIEGYKVRRSTLLDFAEKYEGYDFSNPDEVKKLF